MKYKVTICAREVHVTENLVEACRLFLCEFKKKIDDNHHLMETLLNTSFIEAEIDDINCMMNTVNITKFCHAVRILEKDDSVNKNPPLSIPEKLARRVLMACHANSLATFLAQHKKEFAQIVGRTS